MRTCFLKFSNNKDHLADLIQHGHIFIKNAEYFSTCEQDANGQFDKFELITSYHQNAGASITLAGREFKIIEPFAMRNGDDEFSHIFCLYALSDASIARSPTGKVFDDRLWGDFGEYFVFIHDAQTFMKRIDKKIKALNLKYKADFVQYFCPNTYEGDVGPFNKKNSYAHQEEYRIAINKPDVSSAITDFFLGSLEDIAYGPVHRSESKNLINNNHIDL